jgi:hypothetical protein
MSEASLHYAADGGHLRLIQKLIRSTSVTGLNKIDPSGMNAIQTAAMRGHEEVVRELLNAGASFDAVTSDLTNPPLNGGGCPLHYAAANGHNEVVKALLQAGAPVDATTSQNRTALYIAVETDNVVVAKTLLDAGASPHVIVDGKTPVELAVYMNLAPMYALIFMHMNDMPPLPEVAPGEPPMTWVGLKVFADKQVSAYYQASESKVTSEVESDRAAEALLAELEADVAAAARKASTRRRRRRKGAAAAASAIATGAAVSPLQIANAALDVPSRVVVGTIGDSPSDAAVARVQAADGDASSAAVVALALSPSRRASKQAAALLHTEAAPNDADSVLDNSSECVVCLDERKSVLFLPCKHICTCGQCAQALRVSKQACCPLCRTVVTDIITGVFY